VTIVRETFHAELAELRKLLAGMCERAATAMREASEALLSADLDAAERVLAADAELDSMRDECEERAQQMLALQAPVATDLRIVLSAIYCAEKIERMGDLAEHIANTTCRVHPDHVVPDELRGVFTRLGTVTAAMADQLLTHVAAPREGAFAELDATDHEVDDLHAEVLRAITAKAWPHGVPTATTLALVARFHERYADQAVSAAKRIEFVRTGHTPAHPGTH
jgi:phosphate transport system protein